MSTASTLPSADPALEATDAAYLGLLNTIAQTGANLVQALPAEDAPASTKAEPYERMARAVRGTIVLARHIIEHPLEPAQPKAAAVAAARKRIAREVDDAIERAAGRSPRAESLREELRDRLDDPALDLDIVNRPIDATIADIRRDLGLDNTLGTRPWPRRTPDQVRALNALANRAAPRPHPQTHPDDEDHDPNSLLATLLRRPSIRDG